MTVLNEIYEEDLLGSFYGFRPRRKRHDALDALAVGLRPKKVNWILDVDVRGFSITFRTKGWRDLSSIGSRTGASYA